MQLSINQYGASRIKVSSNLVTDQIILDTGGCNITLWRQLRGFKKYVEQMLYPPLGIKLAFIDVIFSGFSCIFKQLMVIL